MRVFDGRPTPGARQSRQVVHHYQIFIFENDSECWDFNLRRGGWNNCLRTNFYPITGVRKQWTG